MSDYTIIIVNDPLGGLRCLIGMLLHPIYFSLKKKKIDHSYDMFTYLE